MQPWFEHAGVSDGARRSITIPNRIARLASWLTLFACASSAVVAQQAGPTGVVVGRVVDVDTKQGIADAIVRAGVPARAARTDGSGHYRLTAVPVGEVKVIVNRLGFAVANKTATVTAGGETTVDFALEPASLTLSQVIITGTSGTTELARVNGASIGVIEPDSIEQGPIQNFSDLLSSRVAGLTVIQNSGNVGTGSRIVLRGQGSASLSNNPLIVIDGVRAYNNTNGYAFGLGGQTTSRFDDLDFNNIENVQVLRGPAAAALYGTEAAAGVIVISTKHGSIAQSPHWDFFASLGQLADKTRYPANYTRVGIFDGDTSAGCSLIEEDAGACVGVTGPGRLTPATHYNLFQHSPGLFVKGYDEGTGLSVDGGSQAITYNTGANWDRQQGNVANNSDRWTHVNGGFEAHPYSLLDLGLTAMYTQRRIVLPLSDNAVGGVLSGLLLGNAAPGGYFFDGFLLSPENTTAIRNNEAVDRVTLGASGTLRAFPWLTLRGNVGVDYVDVFDYFVSPPAADVNFTYTASAQDQAIYEYTGAASIAANYPIVPTLKGTTTIGGEWVDQSIHGVTGEGSSVIPGTNSVAGATGGYFASENNSDIVNIGGYVQQQFAWRDVLFATASARLDGNSAFGSQHSTALYPAGNISYNISDEPYWKRNDIISSLRYRIAGGQSGREPTFRLAQGSFTGASYNLLGAGSITGLVPNSTGNADLRPERSTEYETGFDVGFWRDRISLVVTAYDRTERDLVQAQPVDISTGIGSIVTNIGKIDNRGLEFTVNARIIQTEPFKFDLASTLNVARNKLVNLGSVGSSDVAFGNTGAIIQENIGGQPLGVFTAVPYTYKDLNHDGVIEPNEITYGSKPVTVGEPGPREELTLSPTFTIFKYFQINAVLDRRDGITVYDGGDEFRTLFQNGRESNDPTAPLKDQAAAVATEFGGTDYGYLLNGSFWKLREVSLKIIAPDSWVHRYLRGRTASLTLSGRNLATATPYRGLDPEVSEFGGQPTLANAQFFTQPPLRAFVGRIDISW